MRKSFYGLGIMEEARVINAKDFEFKNEINP